MEKYKSNYEFAIIAHRGASGLVEHENTIEAFEKAIEVKADSIECDLRKTLDNVIVINHDKDIDSYLIKDYNYDYLNSICEKKGYHLATLSEMLNIIGNRIIIDFEIKEEGYEKEIYNIISSKLDPSMYYIRSFFENVLVKFKSFDKTIKTILLLGTGEPKHKFFTRLAEFFPSYKIRKCHPDFVSPYYKILILNFCKRMKRHNLGVLVWTTNDKELICKCLKKGVMGVITNYPNLAIEISTETSAEISTETSAETSTDKIKVK